MTPLVVAVISAAVGYVFAQWLARRAEPTCLCAHHYGAHDPTSGACQASVQRKVNLDDKGRYQTEWAGCACLCYTGPKLPRGWVTIGAQTGGKDG